MGFREIETAYRPQIARQVIRKSASQDDVLIDGRRFLSFGRVLSYPNQTLIFPNPQIVEDTGGSVSFNPVRIKGVDGTIVGDVLPELRNTLHKYPDGAMTDVAENMVLDLDLEGWVVNYKTQNAELLLANFTSQRLDETFKQAARKIF